MATATSNATSTPDSDFRLYRYDPSLGPAILFIALFFAASSLHLYQLIRTRTWFFIPFVVGGFFESVGYIGRAIGAQETPDWSVGGYVIQSVLILVAPALFAASIYMELSRIMQLTDGGSRSLINTRWLTKIFVAGDVFSFLMQSSGGGIMAGGSEDSMKRGENIIIGGLVLQIIFFTFFIVVASVFHYRMHKRPSARVLADITIASVWKKHLHVLYGGSWLIWIRSLFRLVEYAQGNDGYLISHEWFLYVFDAVLMLATMLLFAFVHPSELNALLKGGRGRAVRRVVSVYSLK
ncbi:hypothetical protein G647_03214 [Cladophialophora carrionii CBS 160.54]|uniref:RTA1 like protein n=1 Tax=Cladophialophora carrionii CBS 160.54 TaxID=1279043 RepID=V9DKH6_9EURO|nr:uncharacterized protein G647_03214 [Cladophialophora carrionii CBS 160.54]ETI26437.1 hypothetical protein G647_03214 [Cladophialophora carrionii CBS 160.54]